MKIRQRSIRVFEVECETLEGVDEFIEKNEVIFQEFFLFLKGEFSAEVEHKLQQKGLCCAQINGCSAFSQGEKPVAREPRIQEVPPVLETIKEEKKVEATLFSELEEEQTPSLNEASVPQTSEKGGKTLYDRSIRSGEEVVVQGDCVIMGRVNGGARVIVQGNGAFFDQIDGIVVCDGAFALVRSIGKGNLIFCGEVVDKDLVASHGDKEKMKRLTIVEGQLVIKDMG